MELFHFKSMIFRMGHSVHSFESELSLSRKSYSLNMGMWAYSSYDLARERALNNDIVDLYRVIENAKEKKEMGL